MRTNHVHHLLLLLILLSATFFHALSITIPFNYGILDGNWTVIEDKGKITYNEVDPIPLSGSKPANGNRYHLLHLAYLKSEIHFVAKIQLQNQVNPNTEAGMIAISHYSSDAAYFKVFVSNGVLQYKSRLSPDEPVIKETIANIPNGTDHFYLKMKMNKGIVAYEYALTYEDKTNNNWTAINKAFCLPPVHNFGLYLKPGGPENDNISFSDIEAFKPVDKLGKQKNGDIIGRELTSKHQASQKTTKELTTPEGLHTQELPFIKDLQNTYKTGGNAFTDPVLAELYGVLREIRNNWMPVNIHVNGDRAEQLKRGAYNAEIYLADLLVHKIEGAPRKYQVSSYKLYYFHDVLLVNVVHYEEGDNFLNHGPPYILYLTLLSLLDGSYHDEHLVKRHGVITSLHEFIDIWHDAKENNNLCMKGMAACALREMGVDSYKDDALKSLEKWILGKFGSGGAYGEGTDYLNYLNDELLPFYYISKYCGWFNTSDAFKIVRKSGDWLLNITDPSGYVPEVDDACGKSGEHYLFAPYAYLNNDNKFLEFTKKHHLNTDHYKSYNFFKMGKHSKAVLHFLTYYPKNLTGSLTYYHYGTHDGIGKINVIKGNESTSLTLVTDNKDLREKGGSHDQQDHGSIVLRRASSSGIDHLILDPLYAGYKRKVDDGTDMLYSSHNTLQLDDYPTGGVAPCPVTSVTINLFGLKKSYTWYSDNGGGLSEITKDLSIGFDSKVTLDEGGNYNRSVIEYNGTFFVLDRLNASIPNNSSAAPKTRNYSVNFNLPPLPLQPTNVIVSDNCVEGIGINQRFITDFKTLHEGQSKIRLSVFCTNKLDAPVVTRKRFYHRDYKRDGKNALVNNVKFKTALVTHKLNEKLSFISIMEPKPKSESFGSHYSKITGTGKDVITMRKELSGNNNLFVFVNNRPGNDTKTMLPAFVDNLEFKTDAEYGIIEIDNDRMAIVKTHLFNASSASYNGVDFNLPTSRVSEVTITRSAANKLTVAYNGNKHTILDLNLERPVKPKIALDQTKISEDLLTATYEFGIENKSLNEAGPIVKAKWDFGDGTTSTKINPTHVFKKECYDQNFKVTVDVESAGGGTSSASITVDVEARKCMDSILMLLFEGEGEKEEEKDKNMIPILDLLF